MPVAPRSPASVRASDGGLVDMSTNVRTPLPDDRVGHFLDGRGRRERDERDMGAVGRLSCGRGNPPINQPCPVGIEIAGDDIVPGGEQIPRHRQSHRPDADESDPRHRP